MTDDFKIEWFSGSGAGGQHRNKTQNCCRVTHIPTGITVVGTSQRSRQANLKNAMMVCKSRLQRFLEKDTPRYQAGFERVRTYHEPDNRVVDHKSGLVLTYKEVVEGGDLSAMIESRRMSCLED